MAYLMKFNKDVESVVGVEYDEEKKVNKFLKGKTYPIQPNDAVHFFQSKLADFVPNPNK